MIIDIDSLEGWQRRLITEMLELEDREEKLNAVITGYEAGSLDFEPIEPIDVLKDQLATMRTYGNILRHRVQKEIGAANDGR